MSGVEDTVQAIITNATTTANTARDKAIEYSNQAQTAAEGILVDLGRIHDPTKPNVTIPPFNPQEDLSGLFSNAVGNTDTQFRQDFTDRVNDFLNTWFPDFANCLKTTVDGWICSTIAGGVTGIPNAIESQIWERSRNQETKEAARLKSEATEALANRGFSLPSGVLYAQLAMIDQAAADKSSTHNRDVAIKQVDIEIQNIRFAVEMGVRMRLGVVQTLIGYLNTFFDAVPRSATDRAKTQAELKDRLWSTSAAYYQALIAAARLTLDYDKLRVDKDLTIEGHTVESFARHIEARVNAAVAAAEGMGKIAGAALSAQNTLAEISSQTIT
jgi:hypothetical protein